jgi:hypothetical protein
MGRKQGEQEEESRELELKRLLLEQLNVASKEVDDLVNSLVAGNKSKKIIVNGSLPSDILKRLKDLGYDVVELETPEQEYGPKTVKPEPKRNMEEILRTTRIMVNARDPDPGLATKNAEAARALAEKYAKPKQKGQSAGLADRKPPARDGNYMNSLGQNTNDRGLEKNGPKNDGPGGWISDMRLSGNSASCTIHYHSEAERSALEMQAKAQLNTMLNDKSYVRKEANREAYPALLGEQRERSLEMGIRSH